MTDNFCQCPKHPGDILESDDMKTHAICGLPFGIQDEGETMTDHLERRLFICHGGIAVVGEKLGADRWDVTIFKTSHVVMDEASLMEAISEREIFKEVKSI